MNEHPQIKTLEYNHITDGIYIGTNQCCQAHFDEKLKREGIETDISLEEDRVDAPFGVQFYVWIPIKNHTAPTNEQLSFGVATIEEAMVIRQLGAITPCLILQGVFTSKEWQLATEKNLVGVDVSKEDYFIEAKKTWGLCE